MITRAKAISDITVRYDELDLKHNGDKHSLPEWLLIMRRTLQEAEDDWYEGLQEACANHFRDMSAVALTAYQQHHTRYIEH